MARKTRTPTIKVEGSPLASDVEGELLELRARSSVHEAGELTLRFRDPYYALFDKASFNVGDGIEVLLPDASNALTAVFKGEITTVGTEHERGEHSVPVCLVRARAGSHRLATAATYKAYLNQSIGDIVTEIAGRHGLTAECDDTGGPEEYLLQAGTDHAMVTHLAHELGFEWFVDDKVLHFRERPADGGPTLKRSDDTLLRFSARYTGIHTPSALKVYGWDPQTQEDFSGDADSVLGSPGPEVLGSDAAFVTDSYDKAKSTFGTDLVLGAPAARDASEADTIAKSVALELLSAGLEVDGLAYGDPAIKAGGQVTLEEVGSRLAGTYYVTEVEHEFGVRQETVTAFRCRAHRHEPPRLATGAGGDDGWGRTGLVLAVVTNINDPEGLGRVKVWFPSLGPDAESDWARVVIPGVGESRGFDVRPEVNDEVVVGFERGDLRFPFVLGGVWSGKYKPPEEDTSSDGHVVRRQIVSRVGHAITISDGPSGAADGDPERYVEIATADGKTTVKIAEDHVLIEAPDGNEVKIVAGKASLTFSDSGDVEIKAENITVDAKQKMLLKSGTELGGKSTKVALEAKAAFSAKGAMVKVEGSGITSVKGAMVKIN